MLYKGLTVISRSTLCGVDQVRVCMHTCICAYVLDQVSSIASNRNMSASGLFSLAAEAVCEVRLCSPLLV